MPRTTVELLMPVENSEQAERLRRVRNECRTFMVRHQDYISTEQQAAWFQSLDRTQYQPYLIEDQWGNTLGYCVIAYMNNVPWLTAGLMPEYRGKGLGRRVFQTMIDMCIARDYKEIWLDVLHTNERAKKLYESLGFVPQHDTDTACVMRYTI